MSTSSVREGLGPSASGTGAGAPWPALVAVIVMAMTTASFGQEPQPYLHFTRTAGDTVQADARFGYSGKAGRVEGLADQLDDIVTCAISESYGGKTLVGAAYVFVNANLSGPDDANKRRLEPANPMTEQGLGRLAVEIGNPRGPGFTNLVFVSGFGTTATYCNGAVCVPVGGSVEVFDINDPASNNKPVLSLFAPPNPDGGPTCRDQVPHEVERFGHAIALEDITGDGIDDLIVGAYGTDVVDATGQFEASLGRIYILAGQSAFLSNPYSSWVGLNAPESSELTDEMEFPNSGSTFGAFLAVANLHDGGDPNEPRDVAVGRPDRLVTATGEEPRGGSVVVFRGSYLQSVFGDAPNVVSNPPLKEVLNGASPEYQVLRNPFGDYQSDCQTQAVLWNDLFGWFVFGVGDVGSPDGTFDGIDDLIVHAEETDYFGHSSACIPDVLRAGAVFVYYGTGNAAGADIVHPEHVLLMTPGNVGMPETDARFGRGLARVDWLLDDGNPLTMDVPQPALVIGDPDRIVNGLPHAGQVYLIRLPLPSWSANGWEPVWAPNLNAWGTTALTEPGGAVAEARFGAWIMGLNYLPASAGQAGQQLWISARSTPVTVGSPPTQTTYSQAGRFYTFTPYPPGP